MGSLDQASPSNCVRVSGDDEIRVITLARAHRHNSLVPEFVDEIRSAVRTVAASTTLRALVIAAEGRNFSTGGDVAGFAARDGDDLVAYAREIVGGLNAMMLELIDLEVPVVTAVQGKVTGGSLGLVLASDIVLLEPNATFAPYYVDVGFSPDGGWTAMLPQRIGLTRAMSIQLSNSEINADQAVEWGLATEIARGDLLTCAMAHARGIARKRTASVRRTKRLLWADRQAIADRLDAELESFAAEIGSEAAAEGMAAFLGRRPDPRSGRRG